LARIEHGALKISSFGNTYRFPAATQAQTSERELVELTVTSSTFWIRLLIMGDLGFAEAYMYGEVECGNLPGLFNVCHADSIRAYLNEASPDLPY
jgi:cyclopropane-fatty-acyl-phospholipid synthase